MPQTPFPPEVLEARKRKSREIRYRLEPNIGSLAAAISLRDHVDFLNRKVPEGVTVAEYLMIILNDAIADEAEEEAARMAAE